MQLRRRPLPPAVLVTVAGHPEKIVMLHTEEALPPPALQGSLCQYHHRIQIERIPGRMSRREKKIYKRFWFHC